MKSFLLILILLVITFVGCTPESQIYIMNPMDKEVTTYRGEDILIIRQGYYREHTNPPTFNGQEYRLTFVGILDDIVDMTYREYYYEGGEAIVKVGQFMDTYKYDISESSELIFKEYVITLISYDGNSITYIINKRI